MTGIHFNICHVPMASRAVSLIQPLPPKVTPVIRSDFRTGGPLLIVRTEIHFNIQCMSCTVVSLLYSDSHPKAAPLIQRLPPKGCPSYIATPTQRLPLLYSDSHPKAAPLIQQLPPKGCPSYITTPTQRLPLLSDRCIEST